MRNGIGGGDEFRGLIGAGSPCVSTEAARTWYLAGGALLIVVAAAYILTNPGRIDIIDGQLRYEVLANLLRHGRPTIEDPALAGAAVYGTTGDRYIGYGFGTALAALPLMSVGMLFVQHAEQSRFLFALTSSLYGAGVIVVLMAFYKLLGVSLRSSVIWGIVFAFGTLWWPLSVSTFDQVQHGFFLLLALYLAYRGTLKHSPALLFIGGLCGGLLINYAESYALILPAVGLVTLTPLLATETPVVRARRYVIFGTGCVIGLLMWFAYNEWRFGSFLMSGRGISDDFGNPFTGVVNLLVSPGKGIVFYSPTIVLAAWGVRTLWRRAPFLAAAAGMTCIIHLEIVSSLSFFGGDWAWGPRYLVPLLPVCALPWPFVRWRGVRRGVAGAVVATGFVVQILAVSVDHQRFFFERELAPFFWRDSQWWYFRESALFARPGELVRTVRDGVPAEAARFVPAAYRNTVTYAPFGPNAFNVGTARWMRNFSVFYLPRPWPLWFPSVPAHQRPFEPLVPTIALLLTMAAGTGVLAHSLRGRGRR